MENLVSGLMVILTIVLMEALLSVDNVLVIAAMTGRLPEHQQRRATYWGMAGAYVLRILALLLASIVLEWPAVRIGGAVFLTYLMASHLGAAEEKKKPRKQKDLFWPVVFQILLADLAFAIDNVAAAVALSRQMWAIVIGVTLGIVTMVLLADRARALIKRMPILEPAAYLVVGFVGALLLFEEFSAIHLSEMWKVGGVVTILLAAVGISRLPWAMKLLQPVFNVFRHIFRAYAWVCELPVILAKANRANNSEETTENGNDGGSTDPQI